MAKDWTVLVYLAADNDLAPFGLIDLNEMELVGSTDKMDVVVQFDGSKEHSPLAAGSCRYHIDQDNDMKVVKSQVVQDLGEVDMGSKETLKDFLNWGIKNYPSEKYFLIIWNHGNGWYQSLEESSIDFTSPKDVQDIMDAVELIGDNGKEELKKVVASKRIESLLVSGTSVRPFAPVKKEYVPSPFHKIDRAVAIDEGGVGGPTALSTTDIREALEAVEQDLGTNGKMELIGFDACLMSMIEVYNELKGVGNFAVASMKTEPGDGWPYDKFLAALAANPSMNGAALGSIVVDEYDKHYKISNESQENPFWKANCTLATVDLSKVEALSSALHNLGLSLKDPQLREMLWSVVVNTQHCGEIARTEPTVLIQLTAHRDIVHFAQNVKAAVKNSKANAMSMELIAALADKVISAHNDCIVHFKKLLATPLLSIKDTNGIAISIPFLRLEASYSEVDFGKGGWTEFIKFFKATPQEAQALIKIMTGGKIEEESNGTEITEDGSNVGGSEIAEDRNSKFDSLYDE
jgi:hypothetical protein